MADSADELDREILLRFAQAYHQDAYVESQRTKSARISRELDPQVGNPVQFVDTEARTSSQLPNNLWERRIIPFPNTEDAAQSPSFAHSHSTRERHCNSPAPTCLDRKTGPEPNNSNRTARSRGRSTPLSSNCPDVESTEVSEVINRHFGLQYRLDSNLQVESCGTMAPGYRASGRDRNRHRTYVDHDVFEGKSGSMTRWFKSNENLGLPVRNWRRDTVTIAPPPIREANTKPTDKWDVELPWGMPKDSHLLPQYSQDLLRAARSGKLYLKRSSAEEEEIEVEVIVGEKPEKKEEDDTKEKGFSVMTWKQVPRHQEGPEIEYLAKRRKGLVGNAIKAVITPPIMTQTKVKRTDAEGNSYVEDVVLAQGAAIEGEVISQVVIPDVATANIMVAPQRRRDRTRSKRKSKASGRGRKKKAAQAPTSGPGEPGVVKAAGEIPVLGNAELKTEPDDVKVKASAPKANDDAEMGDDSIHPSGDDGEEDEEGSSEDDDDMEVKGDGEGNDENEGEMDHNSPGIPGSDLTPPNTTQEQQHTPPEILRPTINHEYSGSPLKKMMTPTTDDNRSINVTGDEEAEGDMDDHVDEDPHVALGMDIAEHHDYPMEDPEMESSYDEIRRQIGSPDPAMIHDTKGMPLEVHGQHEDDSFHHDEMLLDGDMDDVDFSAMAAVSGAADDRNENPDSLSTHIQDSETPLLESTLPEIPENVDEEVEVEGEDGFEDLLGSLNDHLDAQDPDAPAAKAVLNTLEDVETAVDPDAALEIAAAVARTGIVAEAAAEGEYLDEPLVESVLGLEATILAEVVERTPQTMAEPGTAEEKRAEGVRENLYIPIDAFIENRTEERTEDKTEEKIEERIEEKIEHQPDHKLEELEKTVDIPEKGIENAGETESEVDTEKEPKKQVDAEDVIPS